MPPVRPESGLSIITRQGHPDFLDLPWDQPLEQWEGVTERLIRVRRGLSRHVVRMVQYEGRVYALKETIEGPADHEYRMLRRLEDEGLPSVRAVGVVTGRVDHDGNELGAVLISRFLDFALPYQYLFRTTSPAELRSVLIDAAVVLFVRLHLAGFYWGDASLANVLFRRNAGALMAYLVDAETSEWKTTGPLGEGLRQHDLQLATENILGGLADAVAGGDLSADVDIGAVADEFAVRYGRLWDELTQEEEIPSGERWRIRARIERLNEMGFDVEEIAIETSAGGDVLRIRPIVVEEGHLHRRLLNLTGLAVQENQARTLLNALDAYGAFLEREAGRPLPEAVKAYRWLAERYEPVIEAIPPELLDRLDPAELIFQFLEHRYLRSAAENRQLENPEALVTFIDDVLRKLPAERTLVDEEDRQHTGGGTEHG